jgi:hypothetical protein
MGLTGRKNILGRLLARTYILEKTYPGLDIVEWTSPGNDISRKDFFFNKKGLNLDKDYPRKEKP